MGEVTEKNEDEELTTSVCLFYEAKMLSSLGSIFPHGC
jgi:hypothetical protein